ncbi:MAG: putative transcriptional regulator [Candidatus Paceibacteria bacterium]|jgi:predicted transcriptional regulator
MKSPQQKSLERKKKEVPAKSFPEIQTLLKGGANHFRAHILYILSKKPGITLEQLNELVGGDFKNISFHTRKLHSTQLIYKRTKGNYVHHYLSNEGKSLARFISTLLEKNII